MDKGGLDTVENGPASEMRSSHRDGAFQMLDSKSRTLVKFPAVSLTLYDNSGEKLAPSFPITWENKLRL